MSFSSSIAVFRQAMTEGAFRSRFGNIGHLLSGNAMTLVLGLVATALTARALGPTSYGMLALMVAFAQAMQSLVSFQSWQPIIRYGAALRADRDGDALRSLFKFGYLLDFGTAVVSWLAALVAIGVAGQYYRWDAASYGLVLLYSTSLLLRVENAPTGILRLAGRFRATAYLQVASMAVRMLLCLIAFLAGAGLTAFVPIWAGTQILGSLLMFAASQRALRQLGLGGVFRASLQGIAGRFPGLWGFTWSSNLSLTLWSTTQQLDTLMVGALVDPAAAGLYHIAKRMGRTMLQAGAQVQAVVYPEIAQLWHERAVRKFRGVVIQTELILAAFGMTVFLSMMVAAGPVIRLLAGAHFDGAAPLLVIQMLAVVFLLSGSIARAALLAMGAARPVFFSVLVVVLIFYGSALPLIRILGPMGANIAHVLMGVSWTVLLSIQFRAAIRKEGGGAGRNRLFQTGSNTKVQ